MAIVEYFSTPYQVTYDECTYTTTTTDVPTYSLPRPEQELFKFIGYNGITIQQYGNEIHIGKESADTFNYRERAEIRRMHQEELRAAIASGDYDDMIYDIVMRKTEERRRANLPTHEDGESQPQGKRPLKM